VEGTVREVEGTVREVEGTVKDTHTWEKCVTSQKRLRIWHSNFAFAVEGTFLEFEGHIQVSRSRGYGHGHGSIKGGNAEVCAGVDSVCSLLR